MFFRDIFNLILLFICKYSEMKHYVLIFFSYYSARSLHAHQFRRAESDCSIGRKDFSIVAVSAATLRSLPSSTSSLPRLLGAIYVSVTKGTKARMRLRLIGVANRILYWIIFKNLDKNFSLTLVTSVPMKFRDIHSVFDLELGSYSFSGDLWNASEDQEKDFIRFVVPFLL